MTLPSPNRPGARNGSAPGLGAAPASAADVPFPRPGVAPPPPGPAWTPPTEYEPFPVAALPPVLREYAAESAAAIPCDPSYIALPALAVVASCVGNTRILRIKRRWWEPAVIWSAVVGRSGTMKTAGFLQAVSPLRKLQLTAHQLWQREHREWKECAKQAKRDQDEPPDEPKEARTAVDDITIESLAGLLADNPRGLLVAREELRAWFGSFQRYHTAGTSDLSQWLSMHGASTVVVDRKTGDNKHLYIARAAVSITGTIQPKILARAMTPENFESGLVARLFLAMPPLRLKRWTEDDTTPELEERYTALVARLLAFRFYRGADGVQAPYALQMDEDARRCWVRWYNEWAPVQYEADEELAAAYAKLEGGAARLALLHHCCSHAAVNDEGTGYVREESMEAGITLARWFAREACRIYDWHAQSDEWRITDALWRWVASRPEPPTPRDLQRANGRAYRTAEAAKQALQAFVGASVGFWRLDEKGQERLHLLRRPADMPPPGAVAQADSGEDLPFDEEPSE
jgi:hypothetical protein